MTPAWVSGRSASKWHSGFPPNAQASVCSHRAHRCPSVSIGAPFLILQLERKMGSKSLDQYQKKFSLPPSHTILRRLRRADLEKTGAPIRPWWFLPSICFFSVVPPWSISPGTFCADVALLTPPDTLSSWARLDPSPSSGLQRAAYWLALYGAMPSERVKRWEI